MVILGSAYYLFMFSLVYAATPEDLKGFFSSSGFCFLIDSFFRPLAISFVTTALMRLLVRRNSRLAVRVLSGLPELSYFSSSSRQKSSDSLDALETTETQQLDRDECFDSSVFLVDDSEAEEIDANEEEKEGVGEEEEDDHVIEGRSGSMNQMSEPEDQPGSGRQRQKERWGERGNFHVDEGEEGEGELEEGGGGRNSHRTRHCPSVYASQSIQKNSGARGGKGGAPTAASHCRGLSALFLDREPAYEGKRTTAGG
uniref:Transmembrane protein n=2 Tax=Chromera velia CCMP2878 TaxID=1169474 RepID=A0A0K6SB85_9ALVE|eukprot:Cvel_13445.t1-p1 / transcript=Cvel_13445.t1 / gene=Cvel_13445 / organism=Chromera_velia_CCMP2878 / gene_product=hypothetical protein / transcript_product=hypothetical protein / location=Cvel_scaffold918:53872-55129(-) / protein_length=255 / sequence_SO=supercontig / SO=protein_coding / is_pseudo=false